MGQGSLDEWDEAARKMPHSLSWQQLQILDNQLFRPGSTMWSNTHFLVRFNPEEVDALRLCDAVNAALRNHPGLSIAFRFDENNEIKQQYVPGLLPEVKVRHISRETAEALPDVLVMPFDRLIDSCLCRVGVFRSPDFVYLFMDTHHLLLDGGSLGVVLGDIVNAYFGGELKKDYYFALLAEEEKRVAAGSRAQDKAWFHERYGDEVWCNNIPASPQKGSVSSGSREVRLAFSAEEVRQAEAYWGVSHSVLAIAAALVTLSQVTGKQHVMVSWIFNNRLAPEAENAVGMLIKGLPAAARMEEFSSTQKLLLSVKEQVAEGIAHDTYDATAEYYQSFLAECIEVNLQLGINGDELEALHPTLIPLEDDFSAPGGLISLDLLENEYGDGGFDSELEYAEGMFGKEQIEAFHDRYIQTLESLIQRKNII